MTCESYEKNAVAPVELDSQYGLPNGDDCVVEDETASIVSCNEVEIIEIMADSSIYDDDVSGCEINSLDDEKSTYFAVDGSDLFDYQILIVENQSSESEDESTSGRYPY